MVGWGATHSFSSVFCLCGYLQFTLMKRYEFFCCTIFYNLSIIKTVSTPWGPKNAPNLYTREDILANSITFYRNSFVSFNTVLRTHFPICSYMTVWYDPAKPSRAYVERYCGVNRYYKWAGIIFSIMMFLVYIFLIFVLVKK